MNTVGGAGECDCGWGGGGGAGGDVSGCGACAAAGMFGGCGGGDCGFPKKLFIGKTLTIVGTGVVGKQGVDFWACDEGCKGFLRCHLYIERLGKWFGSRQGKQGVKAC